MSGIPVIETERLILRGHRPGDFAACAAMWADPAVVRHIGGKPFTEEEVWARLLRYAGLWAWLGYGYWAMEEKATGMFAGDMGLADWKRHIDPPLDAPELGWILASPLHGQGLATEAVRAVLAWASRRTTCIIHPGNLASIRVAEKCGYRKTGHTDYKGEPVIAFHREP